MYECVYVYVYERKRELHMLGAGVISLTIITAFPSRLTYSGSFHKCTAVQTSLVVSGHAAHISVSKCAARLTARLELGQDHKVCGE